MTRWLLDTDILSEIVKGKDLAVASRVEAYLEMHERLTTSAVETLDTT